MSYVPIGDYALIGDCRTAALVSREGSIDWLCLPDFSSPSIFAALLDEERGGQFSIRPTGPFRMSRRYIPDTNVLETEFRCEDGIVRLTDFLPVLADGEWKNELQPAREVLRIVECVAGSVEIEERFAQRPDYARAGRPLVSRGSSAWALQYRDELILLHSEVPLALQGEHTACGTVRLACGDRRCLSLSYAKSDIAVLPLLGEHAVRRRDATVRWWRKWVGQCRYDGPYRAHVVRSALVLKSLAFALSGAVIAAPTTSLPEAIGGGLNWDYRFCWLRDAELTLTAFSDLGYEAEAQAFLNWLLHSTRLSWPQLQVLYDIYGETRLPETELTHLEGYRTSSPVRIGNDAHRQVQLDIYGSVIAAAFEYVERGGGLSRSERRLLVGFGREVCRSWRDPDHSIWEVRGDKRHYTYSKLLCWAALDRLLRLHAAGVLRVPAVTFRRGRDALRRTIETEGYSRNIEAYTGTLGGTALDASLLRMTALGYRRASDPRMQSTFVRLVSGLGRGALLRRYDEGISPAGRTEGAFAVCGFWAVDHLARLGDTKTARRRFEELLGYGNDLGLFAEEIDPESGRALGNFPQAFTHAGLINAALALARAENGER